SGLSAIQGLNLALFIDTQDQSFGGRVQIQSDDIGELFQEMRIPGEFKVLGPMRLDLMTLPNPIHRGLAHTMLFGHGTTTPVSGSSRTTLKTGVDDGGH